MINRDQIQQEVEKTLQSLDQVKRAEANPFLFTRIKTRMQRQTGWEKLTGFISRPVIAYAVLLTVIAANAFVLSQTDKTTDVADSENITVPDISEEYAIASATDYDFENTGNE